MRRIIAGRGLIAAMEQEENAAVVNDENTIVVDFGDNAESSETELIEVADAAADGEAAVADIEETAEIAEALESLVDALKVSAANGGMDRYAAEALGITTQYLYKRLGENRRSMPALESFGGTTSRVESTKLALEDLKDVAKKAWASIVAAFERIIAWAKDFYTKIFTSYEKLDERAKKLLGAASKLGETPSGKLEKAGFIDKLVVRNKEPNIKSAITIFKSFAGRVFTETTDRTKIFDSLITALDAGDSSVDDIAIPDQREWWGEVENVTGKSGFPEAAINLNVYRSVEQFGGMALITRLPKTELKGKDAAAAIGGLMFTIGKYDPEAKEAEVNQFSILSAEDIKYVANAVVEISKIGIDYKTKLGKIEEQKKKLIAIAKKYSEKSESGADAKKVLTGLTKVLDQPAASASVYNLRTCKALLDYVELSAKQYGAKAEEKKPEEKPAA